MTHPHLSNGHYLMGPDPIREKTELELRTEALVSEIYKTRQIEDEIEATHV